MKYEMKAEGSRIQTTLVVIPGSLQPSVYQPDLLTADAVFLHPGAKSAGIETEEQRCPVLAINAPTGFQEHLEDVVVFHIGEGFDVRPCKLLCLPGRIEPVQHLECSPRTGDYCPLDDTFQLPHVAGPMVFLQGVHGLF